MKILYLFLLCLVSLCMSVACPWASAAAECSGFLYRSKRNNVPIFNEPTNTSKVIYHLSLGEEICYVGEEHGFAIIDWREMPIDETRLTTKQEQPPTLVFARTVDLWEPKDDPRTTATQTGLFHSLKSYYYYLRSGGVPEDALLPYRPFIQNLGSPIPNDEPTPPESANEQLNK